MKTLRDLADAALRHRARSTQVNLNHLIAAADQIDGEEIAHMASLLEEAARLASQSDPGLAQRIRMALMSDVARA